VVAPAEVAPVDEQEPAPEPEPESWAVSALDSLDRVLAEYGASLGADLRPARVHTTASVNLRQGPGAEHPIVTALPEGTIAVALYGEIAGHASEAGGRGRWTYVVVSGEDGGWTSARFLAADDGCIPSVDGFPGGNDVLVVRATLTGERRALLTVSASTDPLETVIDAWELNDECAPNRMSRTTLGGIIEELRPLDDSDRYGGHWQGTGRFMVTWRESLEHVDGAETEWTVILAGRDEPLWHDRLSTDSSIPRGRRDRVRVRSEDASGTCPFSISFPNDTNKYGAGGEYCFLYHSRSETFRISW